MHVNLLFCQNLIVFGVKHHRSLHNDHSCSMRYKVPRIRYRMLLLTNFGGSEYLTEHE